MDFTQFVDTVRDVLERDFTHEPVSPERLANEADFALEHGTGKLTSIHDYVQVALQKPDGTVVTPRRSEPVEATIENASLVARFFARGADDDV